MKKIVMIANFVNLPWETGNCRFMYLLNNIDCKNNNVELITTDFCHNKKKKREIIEVNLPFKITFLHEPGYKKNISLKRFYSHYIWGKNVKKYLKKIEEPDVIYCSIPSLTGPLCSAKYCEKNKVKFIIDVQDLWPEAFQMIFNPPIINKIVYFPFKLIVDGIYKRADEICAVSETYAKRAKIVNNICKEAHCVFLGTDLELFDQNIKKEIITLNDNDEGCIYPKDDITIIQKQNFKLYKPNNEIWIAYCGTLGSSYDLENTIKAISKIKNDNLRFIVMGNGPLFEKFIRKAKEEKIKAIFTGRIPYDMMCNILHNCDIAINPIIHMAAQSIINKHADYVASGLPIISTQENKEFCDLIDKYKIGYNCKNEDINEIVSCINELLIDEKLRKKMGKNARLCAEEKFDRKKTYREIIDLITESNQKEDEYERL